MKLYRAVGTYVSLFVLGSMPSLGTPAANVGLGGLFDRADAVIVGTITNVTISGGDVVLDVQTVRAVKGAIVPGTKANLSWAPSSPLGAVSPSFIGATGVWFLKQDGVNWTVLPVASGSVPITAIFIPAPPASPVGLYDSAVPVPTGRLGAELSLSATDPKTSEQVAHYLLTGAADDLDVGVLTQMWNQLGSSSSPQIRAIGLAGEIRMNLPSGLSAVGSLDPSQMTGDYMAFLASSVCRYSSTDGGGIQTLGKLTQSAYPVRFQFCAAHALRSIHSKETLQHLSVLLDSSSPRIQYEAVAGIASFANGLPVETPSNVPDVSSLAADPGKSTQETRDRFPVLRVFSNNPQLYLQFWKSWLQTHP